MTVSEYLASEVLRTERLDLLPLSLAVCEAVLTGDRERAGELLGVDLGEWPRAAELRGAFPRYIAALRLDPTIAAWLGRAVVLRERGLVIGSANLKGLPTTSGRVEVGYGLVDAYQGQGYAREAVAALLERAFEDPRVREVTAEIEPDNERSVRLAEALGFIATGLPSTQHGGHLVWLLRREAGGRNG